jgi:hypothetical protein
MMMTAKNRYQGGPMNTLSLRLLTATILCVTLVTPLARAQTTPSPAVQGDEAVIRQLIEKNDRGEQIPFTKDSVRWSGAYKKPVVGNEKPEEVPGTGQVSSRTAGSTRTKTTPVRIEIAKAGDMAYEFSNAELSYESGGKTFRGPTSILRVWKKEGGQWKVAAHFARPHYADESTLPRK